MTRARIAELLKEAAEILSTEEYHELLSNLDREALTYLLVSKLMRARGAQPGQTAAEVLTREDREEIAGQVARLQ